MKTKLRNTWVSKLMALCLAVVMMLSMSMTVFAAINADTEGTITISGLTTDEGTVVTAYKVIDVNFDYDNQQPTEPVYTWTDEMSPFFSTEAGVGYARYIDTENDNAVTDDYFNATAAELSDFYTAVLANTTLTGSGTATINAQGTASMTVEMGQYLLSATPAAGQNNYKPVVANVFPTYATDGGWSVSDADVVLKGSAPGIEKEIDTDVTEGTETDGSVAIGDTVPYVLTVDIPAYPDDANVTSFVIGDSLSTGLTLNEDTITVETENGDELTENTHYTLTSSTNGFTVTMTDYYDTIKEIFPEASQIIVKYTATVNANAFTVDDLGNEAFVGYTNDPYDESGYDTTTDEEEVYTYGISMIKTVEQGDTPDGAVFELRATADGDAISFVSLGNGAYRLATEDDAKTTTDLAVGNLGNGNWGLQLQGLDLGSYYLRETIAPEGYVLPDADIVITLNDDEIEMGTLDNSTVQYTSSAVNKSEVTNASIEGNVISFNFTNVLYDEEGNFELPTTGGIGTMIFTIAGILLMGGAVALIVVAARKKRG